MVFFPRGGGGGTQEAVALNKSLIPHLRDKGEENHASPSIKKKSVSIKLV